MAFICSIIALLLLGNYVEAQHIPPSFVSARQHGLLNIDICAHQWDGYIQNSSLIVFSDKPRLNLGAGTGYLNFGINHYALYTGFKLNSTDGITSGLQSYGTDFYKEFGISLSYNKRLWPFLAIGIQQKYITNSIPGHQSRTSTTTMLHSSLILPQYSIALSLYHDFGLKHATESNEIVFNVGGQIQINENLNIFIKGNYNNAHNWHSGMAIQTVLTQKINLSLSIQIHPLLYGVGLRLPLKPHFFIEISNQYHPIIGHNSALGLQWIWANSDPIKHPSIR